MRRTRYFKILTNFMVSNNKGNISGAHTFSTIRIGDLFLLLAILFWAGFQCARIYVFLALAPTLFILGAATKRAQTPFVT